MIVITLELTWLLLDSTNLVELARVVLMFSCTDLCLYCKTIAELAHELVGFTKLAKLTHEFHEPT